MIRRNLTRRLGELEARTARPAEPMIAQIVYVSPDGSEEDGPRYELPMPAARYRPWPRGRGRWR